MDIYVSACAPASPVLYHTKTLRRHVLTQPHTVLRPEKCHPVLRHGPRIDPEYDNRATVAAAYRNRSLIVGRKVDILPVHLSDAICPDSGKEPGGSPVVQVLRRLHLSQLNVHRD